MTQTSSSTPRRLVAIGKFESGQPVYTACDPDLLATGTTAAGKSWTANLRRPAGERS